MCWCSREKRRKKIDLVQRQGRRWSKLVRVLPCPCSYSKPDGLFVLMLIAGYRGDGEAEETETKRRRRASTTGERVFLKISCSIDEI